MTLTYCLQQHETQYQIAVSWYFNISMIMKFSTLTFLQEDLLTTQA